jgi:hypothetical protein
MDCDGTLRAGFIGGVQITLEVAFDGNSVWAIPHTIDGTIDKRRTGVGPIEIGLKVVRVSRKKFNMARERRGATERRRPDVQVRENGGRRHF